MFDLLFYYFPISLSFLKTSSSSFCAPDFGFDKGLCCECVVGCCDERDGCCGGMILLSTGKGLLGKNCGGGEENGGYPGRGDEPGFAPPEPFDILNQSIFNLFLKIIATVTKIINASKIHTQSRLLF